MAFQEMDRLERDYRPMWVQSPNMGQRTFRIPVNWGAGPYFYTTEGATTTVLPMEAAMECNKMKPFSFCIIKHPTVKEEEEGIGAFLLKNGVLLARDTSQAHVFAGRFIKEEDMGASDRIEVVVRPF